MSIHTKKRLLYAAIGAIIFSVVGFLLPYTYYRYFDTTQYYTVVQPIPVDSTFYKPCDDAVLNITRTSLIDISGEVQTDLALKRVGSPDFVVPRARFHRRISVKKGEHVTISTSYRLPCNLATGVYYWQLTLSYEVRGFQHDYTAVSETFHVNAAGVDPDITDATKSATLTPRRDPSYHVIVLTPTPKPTPMPQVVHVTVQDNDQAPQPTPTPSTAASPTSGPSATPRPTPPVTCLPLIGCIL